MEVLTDDAIPVLPGILDVDEETVAIGVVEQGVIVQYPERDIALLINWDDIVNTGKGYLDFLTTQDLQEIERKRERKEIAPPTKKVVKR